VDHCVENQEEPGCAKMPKCVSVNNSEDDARKTISLKHQIMSKSELQKSKGSAHPRAVFRVILAKPRRGSVQPEATVRGVVDSFIKQQWRLT